MVNSKDLSEEPIEYSGREKELPESDEMESERNSSERLVLFDSSYDPFGYIFRLEDRDDS